VDSCQKIDFVPLKLSTTICPLIKSLLCHPMASEYWTQCQPNFAKSLEYQNSTSASQDIHLETNQTCACNCWPCSQVLYSHRLTLCLLWCYWKWFPSFLSMWIASDSLVRSQSTT
jgi:hypothetical protein